MSEFLTQLLQAVIIAAITVCASFLIRFLIRNPVRLRQRPTVLS